MLYKAVAILRIGQEGNSGKTSMVGYVPDVLMPILKINIVTFASRSTLTQEIMLI